MTSATQTATTTQVYRVYIKATPEAIWDAITKPEWIDRYGYGGFPEYDAACRARPTASARAARWPPSRASRSTSSTARSSRPTPRASSCRRGGC